MVLENFAGLFFQFGTLLDIVFQWEQIGVFDFILPFLLIFAIVYGVLSGIKIFGDNKSVNIIIAVVLGLLAIRFDFFSIFLSEISPRLGVGIVILMTLLILVGLFTPEKGRGIVLWIVMGVGALIFIIILAQIGGIFGFGYGGYGNNQLIAYVVLAILIIGVIIAVAASSGRRDSDEGKHRWAPLFEGK